MEFQDVAATRIGDIEVALGIDRQGLGIGEARDLRQLLALGAPDGHGVIVKVGSEDLYSGCVDFLHVDERMNGNTSGRDYVGPRRAIIGSI